MKKTQRKANKKGGRLKLLNLLVGLILLVTGSLCLVFPGHTFVSFTMLFALAVFSGAIGNIVHYIATCNAGKSSLWTLLDGLAFIALALLILFKPVFFTGHLVLLIFVSWLAFSGFMRIMLGLGMKQNGNNYWLNPILLGILSITGSCFAVCYPLFAAAPSSFMIGLIFILQAFNAAMLAFIRPTKAELIITP
ncbi:MAG: DUF308 domain-containing protein [Clostridia bacterium]|nr:DUF308 domain-containing protein [Clostridia bacterium]